MSFYTSVLGMLKEFTCLFQTKAPMIHVLHDKQEQLFSDFLSCFMKAEFIAGKSAAQLKVMDLKNAQYILNVKDMFVGVNVEKIIKQSHPKDITVSEFLKQAAVAYVACAQHLQKKLPLDSKLLRSISAIDPLARGHSETAKRLKHLGESLKPFLTDKEQSTVSVEAHKFQVDSSLISVSENTTLEVDQWWAAVDDLKKYPALCNMAKTVLTCFHGPMVESSFNLMGDIIDQRSSRMNVNTFNAFQTIKYALKARNTTALKLFSKTNVKHTKVNKLLCVNMRAAAKEQKRLWEEQRTVKKNRLKHIKTTEKVVPSSTAMRTGIKSVEKIAQQQKRKAIETLAALAAKKKSSRHISERTYCVL